MATYKKELKLHKKKLINYIKKDYRECYGSISFLEINRMLIVNNLEYYSSNSTVLPDVYKSKNMQQLKDALEIVDRLIADNYEQEAIDWFSEHSKVVVLLYDIFTGEQVVLGDEDTWMEDGMIENYIKDHPEVSSWATGYSREWDSDESLTTHKQLYLKAAKQRKKDYKDFFNCIAKNCETWLD